MRHIQCPERYYYGNMRDKAVFVAGGITDCPNWQKEMIARFKDVPDIVLLNPRRVGFDARTAGIENEQIEWEHWHLKNADAIMFWFPFQTLCPITLFELGKCLAQERKVFIATHPAYQRRTDVIIQTGLMQPKIKIHDNFEDLVEEVINWCKIDK